MNESAHSKGSPQVRTAGPSLFLISGLVAVLIPAFVMSGLGFLLAPTIEKVLTGAGFWVKTGSVFFAIMLLVGYVFLGLSSLTGIRFLPLSLIGVRRLACALFPGARNVAKALGGHESAMGRSFLIVQNNLVRAWRQGKVSENVLVLLPHCLESSVRARIQEVLKRYRCKARIVGGGSEALQAIEEEKPDALVAVACERDLVTGVTDLGGRLPWVLAVPNIQRHGPCKRTDVRVSEFEAALDLLAIKRVSGREMTSVPDASLMPKDG